MTSCPCGYCSGVLHYQNTKPQPENDMFRTPSPSPASFVERRLTPRCGDGGAAPARIHRERDFGVGYGSSSGYASNRSYAVPQARYFRCR
jgi:hypothetical protein